MRYGAESAAGRPAAAGAAAARPLPSAASNNTQQPKLRAKTRAAFFLLARAAFIGRAFFYPLRGDAPRTPRWRETARRIWPPKPEPVKQAKCGLPLLSDCRAARRNQDTKRRFFAAPRAPHKAHKLGMRDRKTAMPAQPRRRMLNRRSFAASLSRSDTLARCAPSATAPAARRV